MYWYGPLTAGIARPEAVDLLVESLIQKKEVKEAL